MNVRFIILTHTSTTYENLVKIGPVHTEIFGGICRYFSLFLHWYTNEQCNLQGYLTKVQQISVRCRGIIAAVNTSISIAIFQSVSEHQCAECRRARQFGPKLVAMASSLELLIRRSDGSSSIRYLLFGEKNFIK